ncbi:MAG: FtsX-like permease family protein [Promethearchaeota archaeon]
MANFRLFKKSVMMAMRSKKRFSTFVLMYTGLIIWMSISLETAGTITKAGLTFWVAIIVSLVLSTLYAFVITQARRMEIATMKCIGYQNNEIRVIILGEIIWVTLVAFFVVAELLIHLTAIIAYLNYDYNNNLMGNFKPAISALNLIIVVSLFLVAQIGGIWLAYRRVLKLRPIIALRVMK